METDVQLGQTNGGRLRKDKLIEGREVIDREAERIVDGSSHGDFPELLVANS